MIISRLYSITKNLEAIIGGDMIFLRVLRLCRVKNFQEGRIIIVFQKFYPLTATGMALHLKMSQDVKIYLA